MSFFNLHKMDIVVLNKKTIYPLDEEIKKRILEINKNLLVDDKKIIKIKNHFFYDDSYITNIPNVLNKKNQHIYGFIPYKIFLNLIQDYKKFQISDYDSIKNIIEYFQQNFPLDEIFKKMIIHYFFKKEFENKKEEDINNSTLVLLDKFLLTKIQDLNLI